MSKHISPDSVEELVLCDVCQENLENVPIQEGIKIKKRILDEEYIEVGTVSNNDSIVLYNKINYL